MLTVLLMVHVIKMCVCVSSVLSRTGAGSECHYQLTGVRLHGAQTL